MLVDETYNAAMTAGAILRGLTKFGPFRDRFEQETIPGPDEADEYAKAQRQRVKDAAGITGTIAEIYISSIGSLTPAGEVIVSLDDLSRRGFHWDQLLFALPLMVRFRPGITSLAIKLPQGKTLRLSGETLERLLQLDPAKRKQLIAKASKAKSKEASLAIIKRGAAAGKPSCCSGTG